MDMIRSLVFAQPANLTTLPSKTTVTVKEELHPNTSNKRKSDASEEDVLAALRALRQPYEILPQEIRDLGAETLEEAIARSRADRAATASAKNNVSVTVLEGSSAALPPRVTPATATPDFVPFNEPVPLSGPRSGEQIGILNNLCQKRAMRAEFVFEQIGNKHTASLKLGHVLLKPEYEMTYDSKKEVKEVLARKGVELLKQWAKEEAELQQEMDEIHGRKTVVTQKRAPGEAEENWVGILQEYTQAHCLPEPLYQPYQLSSQTFSTTVTIQIDHDSTAPTTFSSPTTPFSSKKAAKTAAARDAVRFLRLEGRLGSASSPPRKKARTSLGDLLDSNITPTTSTTTNNNDTASTLGGSTTAPTLDFPTTATAAHQVHTLSHYLGLQSPEYRFVVDPCENALYSGAAWFPGGTGALAGPVGIVEGVFGRKAAKEECAGEVVKVLRAEIARRGRVTGAWMAGTDF